MTDPKVKPIDPRDFTSKLPNIDKLKVAMQEAPIVFESIKRGTMELSEIIVRFKAIADQFEITKEQITKLCRKLQGDNE